MPTSAIATSKPTSSTSAKPSTNPNNASHDSPNLGIDPSLLLDDYAYERVAYHVAQIGRRYRLSEDKQDDLRQDFYTAICSAARRYDPTKASRRTFTSRVIELTAVFRRRCIRNERRSAARSPLLLSDLQREHRFPELRGPRSCEPTALDLVHDLRIGLARLTHRQHQTAEALKNQTPAEIAAERGRHPSTVYREMASMRCHLSAVGLSTRT